MHKELRQIGGSSNTSWPTSSFLPKKCSTRWKSSTSYWVTWGGVKSPKAKSSGFGEGPNEPWKGSVIWFHRNFRSQDKTKNYKRCFSLTRASTWIEKLWTFFRHHCDWPRSLCHCHSSASPPGTGGSANTVDVVLRWIKTAFGQEIPETCKEKTNMLYVVLSRLQFCRWTATKNER